MMVWGSFQIENRNTYLWRVCRLRLHLFRDERQWFWASEYTEDSVDDRPVVAEQVAEPLDASWRRLITRSLSSQVVAAPLLPDRPVVVVPSEALSIAAQAEVRLYFALPLWLQLRGGDRLSETLCEFGVTQLSNTWLGDTFSGRLCYGLRASIRYEPEDVAVPPGYSLCALQIENRSETVATLDKLAVPCDIMALYRRKPVEQAERSELERDRASEADAEREHTPYLLRSNEIILTYTRERELQVRLRPEQPALRAEWERVAEPRVQVQDSVWHKSVGLLKRIGEY